MLLQIFKSSIFQVLFINKLQFILQLPVLFLTYHMDLYLIVHQVLVFRMQIPLMSGVYHNFKKPITQLQSVRMERGLGFPNVFQVTYNLLSILMKDKTLVLAQVTSF